jgi:hypothetical protein
VYPSLLLRTERDRVSEILSFLVFRIAGDRRSPESQQLSVNVLYIGILKQTVLALVNVQQDSSYWKLACTDHGIKIRVLCRNLDQILRVVWKIRHVAGQVNEQTKVLFYSLTLCSEMFISLSFSCSLKLSE